MIRTYKVYMYMHKVNFKRYIGITCTSLSKRAGVNGYLYRGSPLFHAAILKYGFQAFKAEILQENLTKKEAASLERLKITEYKTMQIRFGYNLQRGGYESCYESVANRPERIERIRQTLIRQRSDPVIREKMSARMKKVWENPSVRKRILQGQRLYFDSDRAPSVKVECLETGLIYDSLRDAEKYLTLPVGSIGRRVRKTPEYVLIKRRKNKHLPNVHVRRVCSNNNVDVKCRELLEKPESPCTTTCPETESVTVKETSGLADQQPSLINGRDIPSQEGSETILKQEYTQVGGSTAALTGMI